MYKERTSPLTLHQFPNSHVNRYAQCHVIFHAVLEKKIQVNNV